jgi:hypothetical protein
MSSVSTAQQGATTADDLVARALKNMTDDAPARETTDGFHLVIDALKLNDIDTIFGLPGIPITDLTRMAQAEGMRVISFRHEQHAGNAAAGRRFPHAKARHLPDGVGAGLPQRPDCAGQRHHQLLPDDPDQRLERARDRRPAAGRLRGDGPARDRQAAVQGGLPRAPCRGHRRGHRAGDPLGPVGPSGRCVPRPAGQAVRADHGRGRGQEIADQGDRPGRRARSRHPTRSSARSTCSRAPRSR